MLKSLLLRGTFLAICGTIAGCPSKPEPQPGPVEAPPSAVPGAPSTPTDAGNVTKAGPNSSAWFVVSKDGVEIATVYWRRGRKSQLKRLSENADAKKLEADWAALNKGSGELGLKMHLPPKDGKGRGPLGEKIIEVTDPDYRAAVQMHLEDEGYDVETVPEFLDQSPPKSIQKLRVSRDGKLVGEFTFGSGKPGLKLHAKNSDSMGMESDLRWLHRMTEVEVRYHKTGATGSSVLVEDAAKPGDADYALVVRRWLIVERHYQPRYKYELEVVP